MFQRPDGILTRLTLGESRCRLENASLPANRLVSRMRARSDSTCAKGSMPAAGSSSIRTSSTREAGTGEQIQVHGAGDVHGPVERRFERGLDAGAQPVGAQEGRQPVRADDHGRKSDEEACAGGASWAVGGWRAVGSSSA